MKQKIYSLSSLRSGISTLGSSGGGTWSANNSILQPLDDNLVAYWKAGDLNDSVGTHTLTNVGSTTFTEGKNNDAFTLNGSSQYLTASDSDDFYLETGAFTIAWWAKRDSAGSYEKICGHWEGSWDSSGEWAIAITDSFGGGTKVAFGYYNSGIVEPKSNALSGFSNGTYYHYAITRDASGNIDFYWNGANVGSSTGHGFDLSTNAKFNIGAIDSKEHWDGQIDEVGIWKGHGMTQEEVTALDNSGAGAFLI